MFRDTCKMQNVSFRKMKSCNIYNSTIPHEQLIKYDLEYTIKTLDHWVSNLAGLFVTLHANLQSDYYAI